MKTLLVTLATLLLPAVAVCQPATFSDEFSGPTLDPAWIPLNGCGSFSLVTSGYLRNSIAGCSSTIVGAELRRQFTGSRWTLDTKVTYSMPPSLGESVNLRISFSPVPGNTFVTWGRHRDDGYGVNHVGLYLSDSDSPLPGSNGFGQGPPPCPAETCYLRITRSEQQITVRLSTDGVNYATLADATYSTPLGNLQTLQLSGASFMYTNAYGDYDYIRVSPLCDPPAIDNLVASPNILWPPDHKMIPVTVSVTSSGGCGGVSCKIISVVSNEPTGPDGDWEITGPLTLKLRAERAGLGRGRIYTVKVLCSDADGRPAEKTVTVSVPHDQAR